MGIRLQVWQCARIQALRDAGWKIDDIASDIKCSKRTVIYQLKKCLKRENTNSVTDLVVRRY